MSENDFEGTIFYTNQLLKAKKDQIRRDNYLIGLG
jgi:hypothetical protein